MVVTFTPHVCTSGACLLNSFPNKRSLVIEISCGLNSVGVLFTKCAEEIQKATGRLQRMDMKLKGFRSLLRLLHFTMVALQGSTTGPKGNARSNSVVSI